MRPRPLWRRHSVPLWRSTSCMSVVTISGGTSWSSGRALLRKYVKGAKPAILYSEHMDGDEGEAIARWQASAGPRQARNLDARPRPTLRRRRQGLPASAAAMGRRAHHRRRLAKDFEASVESARAWLFIASVKLFSRRLARA